MLTAILAVLAVLILRRRIRVPARLAARGRLAGAVLAGVAVLAVDPAAAPSLVPVVIGLVVAAVLTAAGSAGLVLLMARGAVVLYWEQPGGAS